MMASRHHDALVRFIRHTLGCDCPEEVLRSIGCDARFELARVAEPVARVDVGGRLLVYVVVADQEPDQLASRIALAVEAGIADRTRGGFNRFRLVLAVPDVAAVDDAARQVFATCHRPDCRIHLHVVSLAEVPEVARPRSR